MTASINRQPAKFLLVDMTHPWEIESSQNLIPTVKNVLSLATCIKGESRVPAFGLSRIELYYEELYPVSIMKGNVEQVLQALDSVSKIKEVGVELTSFKEYKNLLEYSVCQIVDDFTEKYQKNYQNRDWPDKVHIVLVTKNEKVPKIREILTELVRDKKFLKLKSIDIIQLISTSATSETEIFQTFTENCDFGKVIVTNDSYSDLELVFKDWLSGTESSREHLRLILDKSLTIKCDVGDCIMSPLNLPFGQRFSLTNDLLTVANAGAESSVRDLEVIERISISGICSSFIFGRTKKMYPTRSIDVSSVELRMNQQMFRVVCVGLKNSEEGLLARRRFDTRTDNEMNTYFFISSDGEKLFLNNVAPSELILPGFRDVPQMENLEIPDDIQSGVFQCLKSIPSSPEYLPEKYSSGLYDSIQTIINHKTPSKPKDRIQYPRPKTFRKSKSTTDVDPRMSPGDYVPEFLKKMEDVQVTPKKQKCTKKEELNVKHPALLSPSIKAKHRKKHSVCYDLLEPSDE